MSLFKKIKRKTTSFTIGERVITLRLVEIGDSKIISLYGIVVAIRNPSDSGISAEKEKEIVAAILKGRAEKQIFLEKEIEGDWGSFSNIQCNVMTHAVATEILKDVQADMVENFQSYVRFKV